MAEPSPWRDIDELARTVGACCWLERRIFEITGAWSVREARDGADAPADAAAALWCAAAARRHAELAQAWADRLPVRSGVDRAALVVAPPGTLASAFDSLGGSGDRLEGLAVLVSGVLPGLRQAYRALWSSVSAASEAPVAEVLVRADHQLWAEIDDGTRLLEEAGIAVGSLRDAGPELAEAFKRSFDTVDVFPAVRPS